MQQPLFKDSEERINEMTVVRGRLTVRLDELKRDRRLYMKRSAAEIKRFQSEIDSITRQIVEQRGSQ